MDTSLQWNVVDSLDDGIVADHTGSAYETFYGRIGTVYLIECTPDMFAKTEERDKSFFELALSAIKELILQQIRVSTTDSVGVVFYGTVAKDKQTNPDHITTFLDVKEPSVESIQKIETTLELSRDDFERDYGFSPDYSIGDGLWHSCSLLRNCSFKFRGQKIVLATCNDNPFSDSPAERHRIRKRASDLKTDRVDFQLLPFGDSFSVPVFYLEILRTFADNEVSIPKNIESLDDILPQVLTNDCKPRSFGNMKFYLKKNLSFAVSAFKLFRKNPIPSATKLDRVHNEVVKTVRNYKEAETDEVMLPSELAKGVVMADERINFSEAELQQSKAAIGNFGFQLLGFKPVDAIKFYHFSQSSLFIVPAEKIVKGSEQLFVTLRDCLLERNMVALCYLTTRRTASQKLVYLQPQKEEIEDGVQIRPDGFHVLFLPFAEQFRHDLPLNNLPNVSPALKSEAEKLVKKLSLKYEPSLFNNPKVATFWACLEALALGQQEVKGIDDLSNPNPEDIDKRIKSIATEFNHLVKREQPAVITAEKRPATGYYNRYTKKSK